MITYALLCYIGVTLNAPAWYWTVWGIAIGIKFIQFCISLYKIGRKSKEMENE